MKNRSNEIRIRQEPPVQIWLFEKKSRVSTPASKSEKDGLESWCVLRRFPSLGMLHLSARQCTSVQWNQLMSERAFFFYLPHARHSSPRFLYFLHTYEVQNLFLRGFFLKILALCMDSIQEPERFPIKSGL